MNPWDAPYTPLVPPDGIDNNLSEFEHKEYTILYRPAVRIRPRIGIRLQKLVGEISICCMDLDSVESCPEDSVASRLGLQLHQFPDLFPRQRTCGWRRGRRIPFGGDIGLERGAL